MRNNKHDQKLELKIKNLLLFLLKAAGHLVELEYHLEEVYKATTDQLDWANPEGQQYPHNLLQPLHLIPDNRGRRTTTSTPSGEFLTGGGNVNSSTGMLLTGSLLEMSTPRGGSSLSLNSRLWNGMTTSIWIGS
nr:hypothetical protein [Tanacetum cinerariifolium]